MAPLALAAASALPLLSYLDAKYHLAHDYRVISAYLSTRIRVKIRERRKRLNPFYNFENTALSSVGATRLFLIYQGREYTYREGYDLVLRYAAWLRDRYHIKRGGIVALDFTNKPAFLWIWMGLWALGARPALMNYNLTGRRLLHCVKISTASLVIVDAELKEVTEGDEGSETKRMIETEDGTREVVVFDEATERVVETWKGVRPDDVERDDDRLSDMAMLIYTSGTTGMPKAAVISFDKCQISGCFSTAWLGLDHADRFYTCMPLYHSTAALLGFLGTVERGSTLVLGHRFSTKTFWPEVRASDATVIQYVGETCRYLLAAPPHPLDAQNKVKIAFGNGLRPDVWARFKARFGIPIIAEFYGSTEGSSGSWNLQSGDFGVGAIGRNGTVLRLFLGSGVKLAKMDSTNTELLRDPANENFCIEAPVGEIGELLWKLDAEDTNRSFQGYFRNPSATTSKIVRNVFRQGDAWFRTGDLQRRDQDGLWYFVDRIGDTFRWKSENVSTNEVAQVVGLHPAVVECNVYGISLPNHDGSCGCAAINLSAAADKHAVMRELSVLVCQQLPKYARPLFIRLVSSLEKTGNYKFVKKQLSEEGVNPGEVKDELWWLDGGNGNAQGEGGYAYKRFGGKEWEEIVGGRVKL